MIDPETLFERRQAYPNPNARERLNMLIGLDDHIAKLTKILGLLIHPRGLTEWGARYHPSADLLIDTVLHRPPLVILAGDVGSGKTELAETIGDAVARQEGIEVVLLPLSLSARGQGKVGEMTHLISGAFDYTLREAHRLNSAEARTPGSVILLVDEADALAQSRESEMHHEDRSGVNAFIRGIDRIANERVPAAVIMCTNRYTSLDPAVKRRTAEMLEFSRPDEDMRRLLLQPRLSALGFHQSEIDEIVGATGARNGQIGFTFSDLTQRLIPTIVLDAYPHRAIEAARAIEIAQEMKPTPAFNEA